LKGTGKAKTMRRRLAILAAAIGAALASAGTAGATALYISTDSGAPGATLGTPPLTFTNGSVARYEDSTDTATLFFDEATFFGGSENVDAFELLPNGHMILSTTDPATLGGLGFGNGDLVDYDPVSDIATLLFDDALFEAAGSTDTDAVAVLPNGHILISTTGPQTLGGLGFRDGDVVEYDILTGTTTLFFSEDLFGGTDVEVDAFDVTDDGRIVLSTFENGVTLGGLTFRNGDLALYDPVAGTATLFFSEDLFSSGNEDIDAVAVPEPSASALLALGLVGLAFVGGRRQP
jgi:hypothetical protein